MKMMADNSRFAKSSIYNFGATAVSALALCSALPGVAMAQDSGSDPQNDTSSQDAAAAGDDVIIVSGIRYSIANSIQLKRDNNSIVEAVSAEEIGKLPDVSIAESIARLPGLAAQRVGGRAQQVSVRGLGPDFTTVFLNGRPQASSGYNRAVEFDQYPSELLSSVVVYKTPDASLSGMGLAGTVDLRTVRPLEYGKQTISMNLRGQWDEDGGRNKDVSPWGWRGTVSYIDQNADGTLGWSIGYAHLDASVHADKYKAYGYEAFSFGVDPAAAGTALQLNGQEAIASSNRDVRDGVMGTLEWKPSDSVHSVLDLYYSRFKQRSINRGAQWFSNVWADDATFTGVGTTEVGGSSLATSGRVNNAVPILRNDNNLRKDEIFAAGLNNEFQMDDRTRFIMDLSYSTNTRKETYIETYAGYGAGPFQTRTLDGYNFNIPVEGAYPNYSGFGLNYADASQVSLGDRAPWGGWGQDGLLKSPYVKENVGTVDMRLDHEIDSFISRVELGVNYTHRNKRKSVEELDLLLKNDRAQVLVDPKYLNDPTSLDFVGFGNILSVNIADALSQYYNTRQLRDANHYDKAWEITEDILTLGIKADIDSGNLHGNIGLQYVVQNQSSSGMRINATDGPVVVSDVQVRHDYSDLLPSLNLYYDLGGGHRIRFAAAKVLARPRMDDLRASLTPSYNNVCAGGGSSSNANCQPGGTVHPWSASGGNPKLEPWRAKALDVAYEWYGGRATYFSISAFYKWLDSYIYKQQLTTDFSEFPVPSTVTPLPPGVTGSTIGEWVAPNNGKGGYIRGVEVSGALEFGKLTNVLDGFGVSGSVGYTASNLNPSDNGQSVRIPGLSKWVYNVTGYFEKDGFQARGSYRYRSAFKGEVVALYTNLAYTEILTDKQFDAQIGYSFQEGSPLEGLGLVLQVNNVLDTPYRTRLGLDSGGTQTGDGTPLPEIYEKYGRQFLFGISYNF